MDIEKARRKRRTRVVANYLSLVVMNVCFYVVSQHRNRTSAVDVVGLGALAVVVVTFIGLHWKTGLWTLTHARAESLDERQLEVTHGALSRAYGWFAVICLSIVLAHAVLFKLWPGISFFITVPLAGSLIYLAHTLPASVLAWTELEVPGEVR